MSEIGTAEFAPISSIASVGRDFIERQVQGESMARLTIQMKSARMAYRNTSVKHAATILNMNPVSLKVEDGNLHGLTIPASTDPLRKTLAVKHGGRTYQAAVVTIREPVFIPWIRDVRAPIGGMADSDAPLSDYDVRAIMPLELADVYRQVYDTPGGLNMGGVLVFEGDVHGFLKNPTVRLPKYDILPDRSRSYFSVEEETGAALNRVLEKQKVYCQRMIQQGDEYAQNTETARNITNPHRIWAQYALDMGWKQIAPPWMSAQLESEESCRGCGKGKKRMDAFFCDCGRPYNAYEAFLAGENVPEAYLFALQGKELDGVMKELSRREELKAKFRAKS